MYMKQLSCGNNKSKTISLFRWYQTKFLLYFKGVARRHCRAQVMNNFVEFRIECREILE